MYGLKKENQKCFIYEGKDLALEDNKNKKIKDIIQGSGVDISTISVRNKLKINFKENQIDKELFISPKETVGSLIKKYNGNGGGAKMFSCNGHNLTAIDFANKTIDEIKPKDSDELIVLVLDWEKT